MFKKIVQFDHLRPYFLRENENGVNEECLYDLGALFRHIKAHPLKDTRKRIFGDLYLFHVCNLEEQHNIWELQILHLREKILPGIADGDGMYELIQLDDGKYPAESTTALYDQARNILYMQRNIYGTSIRALEIFLQELSPERTLIVLKPQLHGNQISRIIPNNLYRRLILVADAEQLDDRRKNTSLYKTLKTFEQYQGKVVKLDMGFGRKRLGLLNANATSRLVREAYEFNGTQMLRVRTSEPDDIAFETIDLLDDRSVYRINIEFSRESPITHDRLFSSCRMKYNEEYHIE